MSHEPIAVEPTPDLPARSPRHDGWTAHRQEAFLQALAACGCVREACAAVGMSNVSAYRLRARPSAAGFRRAWDAALDCAMHRLEEAALSRAIHGVPRPIFFNGEQVGEWRHHDERMAMFLLRYRRPLRFGSQLDRLPPPPPLPPPPSIDPYDLQPDPDEAMGLLEFYSEELTDYGDPPDSQTPRALDGANFANFGVDCDGRDAPLEPPE